MKKETYPLGEKSPHKIQSARGRPYTEIQLDHLLANNLTEEDFRIHAETLRTQAEISQQAGYFLLAQNFIRASELTRVPNEELLEMYESLRPGRATYSRLIEIATRLESVYQAPSCASLFREAAEVYRLRSLLKENVTKGEKHDQNR